jgi:hypothetical protein
LWIRICALRRDLRDRKAAREPLEKLLRYCARPPIAQERLQELPAGRIALQLKTPWHDGSPHVVYEPLDLIAKLAALALAAWPLICTLIGYRVIIDSALNSMGWAMELIANHSLTNRLITASWGAMFDA